jgi:hypothetical protein
MGVVMVSASGNAGTPKRWRMLEGLASDYVTLI